MRASPPSQRPGIRARHTAAPAAPSTHATSPPCEQAKAHHGAACGSHHPSLVPHPAARGSAVNAAQRIMGKARHLLLATCTNRDHDYHAEAMAISGIYLAISDTHSAFQTLAADSEENVQPSEKRRGGVPAQLSVPVLCRVQLQLKGQLQKRTSSRAEAAEWAGGPTGSGACGRSWRGDHRRGGVHAVLHRHAPPEAQPSRWSAAAMLAAAADVACGAGLTGCPVRQWRWCRTRCTLSVRRC